ncbi:helix-turn-helix domain-containing protein [Actinoplanes sp. KI2]|uniref:helix-turn-helix domain-containing protein n=1 Tax=Actinoplanes sp. KI2 TaxID=2983315 RepID=UPI0021D59C37|nr:helix-turn-helix transcriptional regulator [Actinoplanes sp. KI2]MCU7726672.1 helix-turn-helix domain-containing protein [Actinoplanes sp. KI2]
MTERRRNDIDHREEAPRMPVGRHRRATGRETEAAEAHPREIPFPYSDAEARNRAKLMDPDRAYDDLIADLSLTYTRAGKPSLTALGDKVEYSKATLSKVFCGKAMPSWVLVQRLGRCFRVPPAVLREWHILWTAANMHRRQPGTIRGRASVPVAEPVRLPTGTAGHSESDGVNVAQTAFKCDRCGSWVNDTALHLEWHMTIDPSGGTAPPSESITGWNARSDELTLLRRLFDDDRTQA